MIKLYKDLDFIKHSVQVSELMELAEIVIMVNYADNDLYKETKNLYDDFSADIYISPNASQEKTDEVNTFLNEMVGEIQDESFKRFVKCLLALSYMKRKEGGINGRESFIKSLFGYR